VRASDAFSSVCPGGLANSTGNKYSYSLQEQARFASKLLGTFTAPKQWMSSGNSRFNSSTRLWQWSCSSNESSTTMNLALMMRRTALTPASVRLDRLQLIFCSRRSALSAETRPARTMAPRTMCSTDFTFAASSTSGLTIKPRYLKPK